VADVVDFDGCLLLNTSQLNGSLRLQKSLGYIISIIRAILPEDNTFFTSFSSFEKTVDKHNLPTKRLYFCSHCEIHLSDLTKQQLKRLKQQHVDLICPSCKLVGTPSFFQSFSIKSQLQHILLDPANFADLKAHRHKHSSPFLQDLCCGSCYQDQREYFEECFSNVSFSINTDGSDKIKSTEFTTWPILLRINELSPLRRYDFNLLYFVSRNRRENMIVAGIFCGKKKPKMNTFMTDFVDQMEELDRGGIFKYQFIPLSCFNSWD
jgi:hypothetical protein